MLGITWWLNRNETSFHPITFIGIQMECSLYLHLPYKDLRSDFHCVIWRWKSLIRGRYRTLNVYRCIVHILLAIFRRHIASRIGRPKPDYSAKRNSHNEIEIVNILRGLPSSYECLITRMLSEVTFAGDDAVTEQCNDATSSSEAHSQLFPEHAETAFQVRIAWCHFTKARLHMRQIMFIG